MLNESGHSSKPTIWIVCPTFPPRICGVGDHTVRLALALSSAATVTVITSRAPVVNELPGVRVRAAFDTAKPTMVRDIVRIVGEGAPDWVYFQYDPYAWHIRYGFNPLVPLLFAEIRRRCPRVRIAMMVHETFPDTGTAKATLLAAWVGAQLWAMGRLADAVFFPVQAWADRFQRWFPKTRVFQLPVGSNVEVGPSQRDADRAERNISSQTIVLGLFGRAGPTRALDLVRQSAERVLAAGLKPLIYYLGSQAAAVRLSSTLHGLALLAEGPLDGDEISSRLSLIDIYLVPIAEGVSARRTSLMAGLAHGLATVATSGPLTDPIFMHENGKSLLLSASDDTSGFAANVLTLARDERFRSTIAEAGRALFEHEFTWARLGERVLADLKSAER